MIKSSALWVWKKHPEDEGWRQGRKREKGGKQRKRKIIDAFYPETPRAGVRISVVLSLSVTCTLSFPLSHHSFVCCLLVFLPLSYVYTPLFLVSTCHFFTFRSFSGVLGLRRICLCHHRYSNSWTIFTVLFHLSPSELHFDTSLSFLFYPLWLFCYSSIKQLWYYGWNFS